MATINSITDSSIKNHLGLFTDEGEADVDATATFLSLSRKELAEACGLSSAEQVRPGRMSEIAKQRVSELAAAMEFVADAFDGDKIKTTFWFKTPNPNFGGSSPKNLILKGRYKKVLAFILSARNANNATA